MSLKSLLYSLALTSIVLGCTSKKPVSTVAAVNQDTTITLLGTHKLPTEKTIPKNSVNFFAIKTKNADLFATQEAIRKALTVEGAGDNHYLTLTPGTYKTTLLPGEFLVVGWYQYYHEAGFPEFQNFLEFMVKSDNGHLMESTLSTLNQPAQQSDFASQPDSRTMPFDGVMANLIELENFKYTISKGELTVTFPAYKDGRLFP